MATPDNVVDIVTRHTYGTWRPQKGWRPLHVVRAEGSCFFDASGKRFLDMSAQLMCVNLGHGNPAVVEAICKQARELAFVAPGFATSIRAELATKLLEVVPKGIEKFFFATSGTEANECAIKMARLYTGKHKVIARYNSYHGSTATASALTGDYRRWFAEPVDSVVPGVIHAPECNPYRPGPFTSASAVVDYYEYILQNEAHVAAMIVEPVVGTNGVLVPPDDYFPRLRALCDKYNVVLIADEVMSGWGRTGQWFAIDHWKVSPDILVTAKGVTSAMAPLGVVGTSRAIADYFEDGWFAHGHTYESHPLTLAPAVAAIGEYQRLGLIERSRTMGETVMGPRLRALAEKHPCVGDVRGLGMFWAVELVRDRATKEPIGTYHDKYARRPMQIEALAAELMKRGVYAVGWMSHFVFAPPLVITGAELDEFFSILDEVLGLADKALGLV